MLKITTCFKNRIPSANLIFKDVENRGVNLIYYPELGNSGINFINLYRKKSYWDYVVIPMTFTFLSHKVFTNNYYKSFKKNIPMVKMQRKLVKNSQEMRSIVIDLTALNESFSAYSKSRSKKQIMEEFFNLVERFAEDNKTHTGRKCYLIVDGNNTDEKEMVQSIFYYSRLNGNKLRIKNIDGILFYGNRRFWPITMDEEDKAGKYFKVNINLLTRYMKEVHGEVLEPEEESPEESIAKTKATVESLYKVFYGRKTSTAANSYTDLAKKADEIEEDPLEIIRSEVVRNRHIPGKSFEEKLSNLFQEKKENATNKQDAKKKQSALDKQIPHIVKTITKNLKELNRKHNGAIELDEKVIDSTSKNFYKPLNIIGFKDFHAYNKQSSEFGETLDQAMFDLLKSIEIDKELGIKVLSIKTKITDTNRDRFKTYSVKIQHKGFGHTKPYTVSFHVPIPSKGKYLKVGGNDYIMINQFFPKPVIKVSPKRVRVFTHFATCSIHLKHHAINDTQNIDAMIESMADTLKYGKKLKSKPQKLDKEKIVKLKDKYDLPDYMNSDIFVNLEIKE